MQLIADGKIDGLRVDHPDGLYDPKQYFERVQSGGDDEQGPGKSYYLVAEKILTGDEKLPENWPIHGTTGYNFSNLVNGLFVDPANERKLDRIYRAFIGQHADFEEIVYECKKLVMDRLLNSELNVLANHLSRMALADRHTCDFTLKSLRDALTEIVACFPVYRTYVTEQEVSKVIAFTSTKRWIARKKRVPQLKPQCMTSSVQFCLPLRAKDTRVFTSDQ